MGIKKLKKNIVVEQFLQSFECSRNKFMLMLYAVIADILFIFSYGFISSNFHEKIMQYVYSIGSLLAIGSSELTQKYATTQSFVEVIKANPLINTYINRLIFLFLIFAVTMFFLYCIFQSISWRLANNITEKKISFYDYARKFVVVNMFWFILFIIYYILAFFADLSYYSVAKYGMEQSVVVKGFLYLLLFVIVYFAFLSYALDKKPIRKSFSIGIKKVHYILPTYLIIIIVFVILRYLMIIIFKINPIVWYVVGFILALPALTWARVLICRVTEALNTE